ncbi:PBD-domain-containing protein, partial [Clavulina sp. PMI_390]
TDFLQTAKKPEISSPYDPVHLTHVGFNSSTGEFTGLPKEWQQLLQESGISRLEQERNPQAVMEIVKFYQEGRGEFDKMGNMGMGAPPPVVFDEEPPSQPDLKGFTNPVRYRYPAFSESEPQQLFLTLLAFSFLALCSSSPLL